MTRARHSGGEEVRYTAARCAGGYDCFITAVVSSAGYTSHVITPSPSLPHVDGSVELAIRGMSSQDITGFLLNNTRLPF